METLYHWLIKEKNYTEDDAEEAVLRYDAGMHISEVVLKDIKQYYAE